MVKLLLAEGDEFSRDLLARRLERHGFAVVAAGDGPAALHAARQQRPNLILMDFDIPLKDARNVIEALKNDPRTFKIPIIMLAVRATPEEVEAAVEAGCASFETKPVVLRRLLQRIEAVLGNGVQAGRTARLT